MKNKHAKGPDGQPLININSGRGRGRPKKNANAGLRYSHIDATTEGFFKANERNGGPTEPVYGFKEVYTEIFIKRAKPQEQPLAVVNEDTEKQAGDGEGGVDEEKKNADADNQNSDDEEIKEGGQ